MHNIGAVAAFTPHAIPQLNGPANITRIASVRVAIPLLFVLLLACAGCRPKGRQLFSGSVTDQSNKPVAEARVEVNGKETLSKGDGTFELSVPAASRYILNISHADFADFSYISRTALKGQNWPLIRVQAETVDPKNPITLKDSRPELAAKGIGGASITLQPDSLVDDGGNAPGGPVRAVIATLDIANGEAPGDWAVRSDDGQQDGFLVSYGAVFIQFTDQTGKVRYQLRQGMTGEVTLPVIPSMKTHAPAAPQARFWYYDTKDGYWKKTGEAGFDAAAGAYTGKIDHLSTINTDIAKFNAACLKITREAASVAGGLKLRIRYHSGGTPFGQAPILVMNDLENAMFRIPSNTNILVELLDAANVPFGDLIVEDPAGTPVVNNVVNTGPQIPAGHTLWPLPPFTDCHPILIRKALTQVEIRINELPAAPGVRDNPSDDYITWAPTFCLARLTAGPAATVVLTNDTPGAIAGGGDVQFAANVSPWPANTTATGNTVTLALPSGGAWVPFVIAGKHLSPSTNDKDTIIEAHLNTASGVRVGTKALMVRVRKNGNTLQPSERSRFLFAWKNFRNQLGANYVRFQEMHRLASAFTNDQGHVQPAFLPWHRAMLLHVERELQKIDPSVALHYWNWDAAAPNVFSQDFIGQANTGPAFSIAEPIFALTNPLRGWNTNLPFSGGELRRNRDNHQLAPAASVFESLTSLVTRVNYGPRSTSTSFSARVETASHDKGHTWPCVSGHVRFPERSAADPLFYLLHSQIDRQWAFWQRANNRHGTIVGSALTFPAPAHYDNTGTFDAVGVTAWFKGSFLDDGQWPWDGTSGGPPGGRDERPLNQATAPDPNVPLSMPAVPMTQFPASMRGNLWPVADAVPRPRDLIDYLGKFRPQDGLGFCYDDVPY